MPDTVERIREAVELARAFMATSYDYRQITATATEAIARAFLEVVDAIGAAERVVTDAAEHCVFDTETSRKRLEESIRRWGLFKADNPALGHLVNNR